jgi:hypothetical protein
MGTVSALLSAAVVALAPVIGFILARFTNEELAPGKKYFMFAQHAFFVLAAFVSVLAHKWTVAYVIAGLVLIFAYLFFKQLRTPLLAAGLLGIAFALTAEQPLFFLFSTLAFLYGMPAGTLLATQKKGLRQTIAAGAAFFAAAIVVGFVL